MIPFMRNYCHLNLKWIMGVMICYFHMISYHGMNLLLYPNIVTGYIDIFR